MTTAATISTTGTRRVIIAREIITQCMCFDLHEIFLGRWLQCSTVALQQYSQRLTEDQNRAMIGRRNSAVSLTLIRKGTQSRFWLRNPVINACPAISHVMNSVDASRTIICEGTQLHGNSQRRSELAQAEYKN